MQRRGFNLGLGACLLPGFGVGEAMAQARAMAEPIDQYPSRPIRILVGFPPGQSSDTVARMFAAKMSESLKQAVFVDNKPAAAGIVAHQMAKEAPPDGYTLVLGSTATLAVNPTMYKSLPYDPQKDLEPIIQLSATPLYLVTLPKTPVNNLREAVAYMKARNGTLNYGSAGNGTSSHLTMESLKKQAGVEIVHIPFKGAAAVHTAALGGDIDFFFETSSAITALAEAGKVKLLAITSATRSENFPNVPTVAEQGYPSFVFVAWSAMMAPAGTPAPIVAKLNATLNRILKDEDVLKQNRMLGSVGKGGTPGELAQFIRTETISWGAAVKSSGATID